MSASAPSPVKKSRWLDWKPKVQQIPASAESEPTKPSKSGYVGFERASSRESLIIRPRYLLDSNGAPSQEKGTFPNSESSNPRKSSRVRLITWNLKEPPIAIETCAVVLDPALFAKSTLEQLRIVLENPKRWVGWTVPQLLDRLAQVGVEVSVEAEP
jgi:hypothetical protein